MNAKNKFREGWVMLLRPFDFAELSKPLQKMTILYAYSEQPIVNMVLNEKGVQELEDLNEAWDKKGKIGIFGGSKIYGIRFGESEEDYDDRMGRYLDDIYRKYSTKEDYKGEIVQCYVEKQLCRFYPDEYNVISRETFEHLLSCDENEYKIEIEDSKYFDLKSIKEKIFYIQSRGIPKDIATKMNSVEAKDAVIFRPQEAILEMFCREHEIY